MELRIFSTEIAVNEAQYSHALLKHELETLDGSQASKNPAGHVVSAEHPYQQNENLVEFDTSSRGNSTRELQLSNV